MAIAQLAKMLCGEDNHASCWVLDTDWQTSVNGAVLLAGSEIDTRPFKSLGIVMENITNDITFRCFGSNDEAFTRKEILWDFAMTAGATATKWFLFSRGGGIGTAQDTAPPGEQSMAFRYMKFEIWSTVAATHGDARVRYTGWK